MRHNCSIQTHEDYFILNSQARKEEEMTKLSVNDIDFVKGCFLRCECQVLTRLPMSLFEALIRRHKMCGVLLEKEVMR